MIEIQAKLRYARMSSKKTRPLADLIRGLTAVEAEHELNLRRLKSAPIMLKLLKSAIASAKHNYQINKDNLRVKAVMVDSGPSLKRFRARAFGRAGSIRKPTSHILMILSEINPSPAKAKSKKIEKQPDDKSKKVTGNAENKLKEVKDKKLDDKVKKVDKKAQ